MFTLRNLLSHSGTRVQASQSFLFSVVDASTITRDLQWDSNPVDDGPISQPEEDPQTLETPQTTSSPSIGALLVALTASSPENPLVVDEEDCPVDFSIVSSEKSSFLPRRSLLLLALQNPIITGFVGFAVNGPRVWSDGDKRVLEIMAQLVVAVRSRPNLFQNLPPGVVGLTTRQVAELEEGDPRLRDTVDRILQLFEDLRRQSEVRDLWKSLGLAHFRERVARCVLGGIPVLMTLPAFPMKSPRASKVLGPIPDLGEVLAISRLSAFAKKVGEVHPPGCAILIASDGRVFNDIYPVTDVAVTTYHRLIEGLTDGKTVQVVGLDELFPGEENERKRDAVVTLASVDMAAILQKLRTDEHFHEIYVAFNRLLEKDSHIRKKKKKVAARHMMLRNECYSLLIRLLFPHHIRLSIHDHSGVEKIGVHLVGSNLMTPWHGVAVLTHDGTWLILRKEHAEHLACILDDALRPENAELLEKVLNGLAARVWSHFQSLPFYRTSLAAAEVKVALKTRNT